MSNGIDPGAFTLTLPFGTVETHVLSVWGVAANSEFPSFAPGDSVSSEPVWRIDLPADAVSARRLLASGDEAVTRAQTAHDEAFARLERFSRNVSAPGTHVTAGIEATLVAGLRNTASPEIVSYETVSGDEAGVARRTLDWFSSMWSQVRPLFVSHSWVETAIDGKLVARTAISRSGDLLSVLRTGASIAQAELHARAVELAYRSRAEVLRGLTLAIRGVVLLGGALVSPGSALLAIPAVWRYLNDLREHMTA